MVTACNTSENRSYGINVFSHKSHAMNLNTEIMQDAELTGNVSLALKN